MPQPLVLRLGRIAEEIPAEAGTYPLLRMVAGRLVAGGSGLDLFFSGGRFSQTAVAPIIGDWDAGATPWDRRAVWLDADWDSGATPWNGPTPWDVLDKWDGGATPWDGPTNWTSTSWGITWDDFTDWIYT